MIEKRADVKEEFFEECVSVTWRMKYEYNSCLYSTPLNDCWVVIGCKVFNRLKEQSSHNLSETSLFGE